ncbi:DUF6894 family protein [Enterovirga aerilata]|uniref:DUF6894 domain-containing protein n=1 Tax=Enterovirga aerilata TaxID=2730920 RepID=A0A849I2N5_9HYPH|nr:hypothetical protein [Enterovirga sp. DB1703]NNM74066.1 hypothetical protein [Enterovirga sp. DB1703]
MQTAAALIIRQQSAERSTLGAEGVCVRCYFHLQKGGEEIRDETGAEVSDLDEARAEALKAIAELRGEDPDLQEDWNGWKLRIVNDRGELLSVLRLNQISHPVPGQHPIGRAGDDDPRPVEGDPEH